jgi:CspA family cold shock protein
MPLGKVKWFNAQKGYGFITEDKSEKDIFLHVSALEKSKLRILRENQKIQFEIKEEKGRLKAINLKRSQN